MAERYYADLQYVKEITQEKLNEHLADNWELLKIENSWKITLKGKKALQETSLIYIVGQRRKEIVTKAHNEPVTPTSTPNKRPNNVYAFKPNHGEPKPDEAKAYQKPCRNCQVPIRMIQKPEGWRAQNLDGTDHRCQRQPIISEEKKLEAMMENSDE